MTTGSRRALAPAMPPMSARKSDPLLALLQRYEAEREAFDHVASDEQIVNWDRIAAETWSQTQDEIIDHQPPATTAAGAFFALDHVLRDDYLFSEREESSDQQMLWLLIKAARDYIASAEFLEAKK